MYFLRKVCGGDAGGGKLKRMVQISGTGGAETKNKQTVKHKQRGSGEE